MTVPVDPGVQAPTGDPGALSAAAGWHDGLGDYLESTASTIEYTAGSLTGTDWDGEAASSYATLAYLVGQHFRAAGTTARTAALTLRRYARELERLQREGVHAVDQTVHWLQKEQRDQERLTRAQHAVADAQAKVNHAQQILGAATAPGGAVAAAGAALGPAQGELQRAQSGERAAQRNLDEDRREVARWQWRARQIWQEAQNEAATATGGLEPLEVAPPPLAGAPATFTDALAADAPFIDANSQLAQRLAERLAPHNDYGREQLYNALLAGVDISTVPLSKPHHSGGGWLKHLAAGAAVGLTELVGGGPEDPLADGAAAEEIELIEGGGAAAETAAGDAAAGEGGSIELRFKEGWSDRQIAAAENKVAKLDQAAQRGEARVTREAPRSPTSAGSRYRNSGGQVPPGYDVDHVIDLQLGGEDSLSNMLPLDSSVNRSLGAQIMHAIKELEDGTLISRFTIR